MFSSGDCVSPQYLHDQILSRIFVAPIQNLKLLFVALIYVEFNWILYNLYGTSANNR